MSGPVWQIKSRQMTKKITQNDFTRKMKGFVTHLQKLPKNVGDLGLIIVATYFEKLPKVQ